MSTVSAESTAGTDTVRECGAKRYAKEECDGPAKFDVVYRNDEGGILDQHPACFRHGLAEVDRHAASGGIARCDLEEPQAAQ